MGRRKEVVIENGRYKGKYLSSEDCIKLEQLLQLDKNKGCVKSLKNIIYLLSPHDVDLIKYTQSNDDVKLSKGVLENTQTIGVAYMYFAKRLILGDSVGLGKTVEVCGLCNLLESVYNKQGVEFRFLYLTGKNLVEQSRDEIIKFTGNYVDVVQGVKDCVEPFINRSMSDVEYSVVGSHSLVNSVAFQDFMRYYKTEQGYNPFDLLVIDEAGDILKNSTTQTYKNVKYLASMFDRVIFLNATAFEKELLMFYNQLNLLDETLLPTKTEFENTYMVFEYGGPYPRFNGKYSNAENFRKLVGYRYLARTRKSTGAVMKDCTAEVIVSQLSKEQKELLKRVSIPNMVYDCPSYFNMGVDTNVYTTPKLASLIELLDDRLEDEKSILIYSRYKEAQAVISKTLFEYGIGNEVMNGDTDIKVRQNIINRFKLGDTRVLITNVQKGLNFGNCNVCIFYDFDSSPNDMVQFEGRMTRSFDIVDKHVYLLVSKGDELRKFKTIVADRAKASDMFAGSDFSCVLSILLNEKTLGNLK